jgi:signal transduction histidine kinase
MPTSLRIALLAGFLALATNLAIIGFIHWQTYDQSVATLRRQVTEQAQELTDVYHSGGMDSLVSAINDSNDPDEPDVAADLLDPSGRPQLGNVASLSMGSEPLGEGYHAALVTLEGETAPHEAAIYLHHLRNHGWLMTARIAGEGLALRQALQRSLVIGLALSILLGTACGVILARYVGRRVRGIATVADRIAAGDFKQRIPVSGSYDSFDRLARQINQMLDRISTLMGELSMLTDSLAHDLRSPVGRLRAAADRALTTESGEQREQLLSNIIVEADSLMRMLTTVLEIGRSEALATRKQFARFDLGALASELAEMYEPVAEEAGVALKLEAPTEPLQMVGHRQLLAQALSNLIENAIKYAGEGGEVVLAANEAGDQARIEVRDRGPGIPPDQRAQARRRFVRLDSSRSAAGAGLGLTLADAIAHLHRGELVLADNNPGLRASLELPARASEHQV